MRFFLVGGIVVGALVTCASNVSHAVLVSKLIKGSLFTSGPSNQQFSYDSASIAFNVDPQLVNWMAISRSTTLADAATGSNGSIRPDGVLDIVNANTDDYFELKVTNVGSGAVSSTIVLDDNGALNQRQGNQAVFVGSHSSVWAVTSINFQSSPIITNSATFPETGALTGFFGAQPGDYRIDLSFRNRWGTAAGHGSVYLLMDVDPDELLRRSLAVETGGIDPRRIDAFFKPLDPFGEAYDLTKLAQAFGVDHFNWLNTMTPPDSWTVEILKNVPFTDERPLISFDKETRTFLYNDDSAKQGQPVTSAGFITGPLEDPLRQTGGGTPSNAPGVARNYAYFIHPPNNDDDRVGIDHTGYDDRAPYWNEKDTGFGSIKTISEVTSQSLSIVPFTDSPSFPEHLFRTGEFVQFETELVGVRADGSLLPMNRGVRWKSNAAHNIHDALAFSALTTEHLPPRVSGGVFDVRITTIPEPFTLPLTLCLGLMLTPLRRRPATM